MFHGCEPLILFWSRSYRDGQVIWVCPGLALKVQHPGKPFSLRKIRRLVTLGAVVFGNRAKYKYGLHLQPKGNYLIFEVQYLYLKMYVRTVSRRFCPSSSNSRPYSSCLKHLYRLPSAESFRHKKKVLLWKGPSRSVSNLLF